MYFVSFPTAVTFNLPPKHSLISPVTVRVPGLKEHAKGAKVKGVFLPNAEAERSL